MVAGGLAASTATSTDSAGSTASAPEGIGAPVMMRTASPRAIVRVNGEPGSASPTTFSGIAVVRSRAFGGVRDHGVAVHRRAIESGDVDVADDGGGEDAARGVAQRHVFGVERAQLRVEPLRAPAAPYAGA